MSYYLLLLASISAGCSVFKKPAVCDSTPRVSRDLWIDSRVDSWNLFRSSDTTRALITGRIRGHIDATDSARTEPLIQSTLVFSGVSNSVRIQIESDIEGYFSVYLNPGIYSMYAGYVGFSSLLVKDIVVKSGDLIESTVTLGTRYGQTEYYMEEDGSFVKLSK